LSSLPTAGPEQLQTGSAIKVGSFDLGAEVVKALKFAVPDDLVEQVLPGELQRLQPRLAFARLADASLELRVNATVPAERALSLQKAITDVASVSLTTQWRAADDRKDSRDVEALWAFLRKEGVNASRPETRDYVGDSKVPPRAVYFWFKEDKEAADWVVAAANTWRSQFDSNGPAFVASDKSDWQRRNQGSQSHKPREMSLQIWLPNSP
jgi:hypothetical protein